MFVVGGGIGGYGQYIAAIRDVRRHLKRNGKYTDEVRAVDNEYKRKTALSLRVNRTQLAEDWLAALLSFDTDESEP